MKIKATASYCWRRSPSGWFTALLLVGALLSQSKWVPAKASASTREFLTHCDAAPKPCEQTIFNYLRFLVDGGFIGECIMHQPTDLVAKEILGEMHRHPERDEEEWIDGLEDALKEVRICGHN